MELIRTEALKKTYGEPKKSVEVLRGISLTIEKGATVAIIGASGVGKSTFLNLLGGLDRPTS
ncbi:partial Macrolide export ATP-binding/permease protein MacB, partial [Planctomycetaceae bacterium]